MTGHDNVTEEPLDPIDAAVDQRLAGAVRRARTTTRSPDRHAFLAAARTRRDRLRRRRRAWTIATPIAAAVIVLVAIGVIATGGDNTTMHASTGQQAASDTDASTSVATSCPNKPGTPNTEPGKRMFAFTPTALVLCTYAVDGRLVATNAVPGSGEASVTETLDYLQRAYVNRPADLGEMNCEADAIAVNRIAVIATGHGRHETAWIASFGCTTPTDPPDQQGRPPESGSATATIDGTSSNTTGTSSSSEQSEPASP